MNKFNNIPMYDRMARSIYNRLKNEKFEIKQGKGGIKLLSNELKKIDKKLGEENYRNEVLNKETGNMNYTLAEMYFDYTQGYIDKKLYTDMLLDVFKNESSSEVAELSDIDTRMEGFMGKYGDVNFKYRVTGEEHTIEEWKEMLKRGEISNYYFNDVIEAFKHSKNYDKELYLSQRFEL